jgi:ribonuclease HI
VLCHARGAASGNPGPAGVGVVLRWGERRREIRLALQAATGDEASLTAVLTALRAVRRPTLPVRVRTDSGYVIGVLEGEGRPAAHRRLVQRIRRAMRRFPDLRFVKVPPDGGEPEDLRALALAHEAARAGGSAGGPAGGPPSKGRRYHGDE